MPKVYKATRSALAENLLFLDGKPISFNDYPFHVAIYDGQYPYLLKKTSRQIGKTIVISGGYISHANGNLDMPDNIKVGDTLLTLDTTYSCTTFCAKPVTWVSDLYKKHCVRITTRQGHIIEVGNTHPIRVWNGWEVPPNLRVGDKIAAIREGGIFTNSCTYQDERIKITAYLIGDGYISNKCISLTTLPGSKKDEFESCVTAIGDTFRIYLSKKTRAVGVRLHTGQIKKWMIEDNLLGTKSATKFIPSWVFDLSKEKTALFINRLWSTDGHAKKIANSRYDISYASISKKLIHQVQSLLWKFGIPSKIREKNPSIYKRRGEYRAAYELCVETQEGIRRFLTEVGALDKTEEIPLPDSTSNNTQDTLPDALQNLLTALIDSGGGKYVRHSGDTLYKRGLKSTLQYRLTYSKASKYLDYFVDHVSDYNQSLINELRIHLDSSVYWDTIKSIEDIGEQTCIDYEVADTHNFILDGIVTHNSTLAANFIIAESIGIPFFKTLYVAPTKEQTSKFSNTRLSKTIHYSPLIRGRFGTSAGTDNVFSKILPNGSEIALSYASDDADRIRGISADRIFLDEIQDMDTVAVLPVVKETAANSDYGFETYTGTPKSMENGIQSLWEKSTQTEWIIPCAGCGSWNYIDNEKSIGLTGPICVKCGHLLNPREGKWYDLKPDARTKGFHISQPMLPRNCEDPLRWDRILSKLETYAPSKFRNEVLGVSDAIGTRLISLEELKALCDPNWVFALPPPQEHLKFRVITAGIDWSGGGAEYISRTVVWIWGITEDDKLRCVYYKVFPGQNQAQDVDEVCRILQTYKCQFVVGDAGVGAVGNSMVRNVLGTHRVFQVQYGSTAKQMVWNNKDRWTIDKTAWIDSYMLLLKRGGAIFANEQQMMPAIHDILNEFEEVTQNGMGKKVWKNSPNQPDDCLHASIYAWIAMQIALGRLKLYE